MPVTMVSDWGKIARAAYVAFGFLGGAASIYSAWVLESQPTWVRLFAVVAVLLLVLFGVASLLTLWPVLRTNPRGLTLVRAVTSTGLVDIESRNEGDRHLPPEVLYTLPGLRELVITGIDASSTFRNHFALIKRLLVEKKDVYFLICDEQTPGLDQISRFERRNVKAEIQEVRDVITLEELRADKHFHIKVFTALPAFTAVMINGDLVPRQVTPQDSGGFVRIQPRRMEITHHEGIVLQFRNTGKSLDGFNLFAWDLREQWKAARPWKKKATN